MPTQGQKNLEKIRIKKIMARIREIGQRFLHSERTPIPDIAIAETTEHLTFTEAKRLKFKPIQDGHRWGKNWGTAWFRLRIRVPKSFAGETAVLLFDLETSECLIFRDGQPVQGLCWSRKEYILFEKADGGERVELFIEAGANARLGAFDIRTMHQPEVAMLNREVWEAYWDLSALADIIDPQVHCDWLGKPYHLLSEYDTRRARIIYALNEAVDLFNYGDPSREKLKSQARQVRRCLKPVYDCPANASAPTFAAMGHAHIDVAWKWPLAESVRKVGRTFSNVLDLMNRYPDFVFAQSQPHLYVFAKERYPTLYEKVRQRVKEGRWVPTGCMWVESDCNLTGGESLIRQILFGTRFFREEFNHEVVCLWLPDVFGYSAAIPQILRRSGIRFFFTTKLQLNQFNQFPYHSFHWEGIDGSRVLAHYMPAEEYSSQVEPWLIRSGEYEYAEKDRSSIQILPFGHGDGGGGPAASHVERLQRYRDLEGMPKVVSLSPREFFERLEKESESFPRWLGELYLENHRGTYTTRGKTKKLNRQAENLLRETEMLSSLGACHGGKYEQEKLNEMWKLVLLNQFHDVLPGSSIDEVYEESDAQLSEVIRQVKEIGDRAFSHAVKDVDSRGEGMPVLAFNSLAWDRTGLITVKSDDLDQAESYIATGADGSESPVQVGIDGETRFLGTVPSIGHNVFHIRKGTLLGSRIKASEKGLENNLVLLRFDRQGRLRRFFDKRVGREVLAPGQTGNRFVLFEDKMVSCGDAWDIDIFYADKPIEVDGGLLSVEVIEEGPVRSVLRFRRSIGKSTITQDVILTAGTARLDFQTTVEWGDEKDVLLKVAFPVNIRSEKARYEIQYGSIERPTHWNTSFDFARFEVPAQRWADLSEGNYGVALLNDCKYGYDIRDNVMRLSLLRASKDPGKNADTNQTHTFTYSLLPHTGDFTGGVVRAGYELNVPLVARPIKPSKGDLPPCESRMSLSGQNIIIDTIKKAEDNDGLIVRLYEAHGWRGRYTLQTSLPVVRVFETDLMENEERELPIRGGKVTLDFKPFEIRTLKLDAP